MASRNKKALLASAGLGKALAANIASAAAIGGKSQLGVSRLTMDLVPNSNVKICYSPTETVAPGQLVPSNLSVVVDPFNSASIKLTFTVGDVPVKKKDYMVFLIVNDQTTPSPSIATPLSDYSLAVPMTGLEILGAFLVPTGTLYAQQDTRVGQASSEIRSRMIFDVNLNNAKLPTLMNAGTKQIYVQAALTPKADYDAGKWDNMILSPANKITLVASSCPSSTSSATADTTGALTVKDSTGATKLTKSGTTSTTVSGKGK